MADSSIAGTGNLPAPVTTCQKPPEAPVPFLVRGDIAASPTKMTPQVGPGAPFPSGWDWCYSNGVLSVTIDMKSFAKELDPADKTNGLCQPHTFCNWGANGSTGCGCNLNEKDPRILASPDGNKGKQSSLFKECQELCSTWAIKDVDCPAGGCIGFGVTLPASFKQSDGVNKQPAPKCFPNTAAWTLPHGSEFGFTRASQAVAGKQCTYPNPLALPLFCSN